MAKFTLPCLHSVIAPTSARASNLKAMPSESILCVSCGNTVTKAHVGIPTPVTKPLCSNLLLSASQAREVRDTISNAQSRISQIDNDIARLLASVNELQRKRATLVEYIEMRTTLIAPIRSLPPEILSEIFSHCMEPISRYGYRIPRLDRTPLLLSQVCIRWRSIALSTPRLWASIALTIRPKYLKGDVLLAKTWLGRSGAYPLSITLASQGVYQNPMQPLMQVFLLHCERWCDVRLSVYLPVLRSLSAAKNHLPMLQKLLIADEWAGDIGIFESAPQLRCITLASHTTPSALKVPWDQIKFCDTGSRSGDICLEILRLARNLESCKVEAYCSPHNPSPVHLPRLRSMTIRVHSTFLFSKLLAPELKELSISLWGSSWPATQDLTSFFLQCSLQTLTFTPTNPNHPGGDQMVQFLRAQPSLVELNLRSCSSQCLNQLFLAQFANHEDSQTPPLVPCLRTITVYHTQSYFNLADFFAAIQLRMASYALKKVEILHSVMDIVSSFDETMLLRLQELRDIGLDIVFTEVDPEC